MVLPTLRDVVDAAIADRAGSLSAWKAHPRGTRPAWQFRTERLSHQYPGSLCPPWKSVGCITVQISDSGGK